MKSKKIITGFLSVAMLSFPAITTFADNAGNFQSIDNVRPIMEVMSIKDVEQPYFNAFTGTVKEITDSESMIGSKYVLVENEEGLEANIIISDSTYIVDNAEIAVGTVISGYFEANVPRIMIYPAQYGAEVVVVESKDENVKVAIFNKDLMSDDNSLKLKISESTETVLQDGKAFQGELTNRKLVVTYGVSTKSIPAQTNPTKIVVLFEKEETEAIIGDASTKDIVVNNKKIESPQAYTNEQGTVMIPLRAIAEALGYDVTWNGESQSITMGGGISLKIGEDTYRYLKTASGEFGTAPTVAEPTGIYLEAAPALLEGTTYVPLSFFREVVGMNNAYLFESKIVIDNEEIIE